jgi:integrase/recombinase XerD
MARDDNPAPLRHSGDDHDPQGMTFLLARFLESMAVQGYSTRSAANSRKYVGYFVAWADQRGLCKPSEITPAILQRYQRYLFHYRKSNGDPLTFRTQLNYLVAVRAWFRWLTKHRHIGFDVSAELELPRVEQRLPKFILTAREAEQVLNMPDVTGPYGLRDRAMLELLYSTGVRRMELATVRVFDLDPERGTLVVRQGKGKKDRVVPIGARALAWVEKYLCEARPLLARKGEDSQVLFLTQSGVPFNADSLTVLVRRYVTAAKIGKTGSCHLFRHTAATLMLENGADIRFIQAMLGHAQLSTTQVYTRVSIGVLKAVHEATHPAKLHRNDTALQQRKEGHS